MGSSFLASGLLNDYIVGIGTVSFVRLGSISREAAKDSVVSNDSARKVPTEGQIINHVDTPEKGLLSVKKQKYQNTGS